MHCALRNAALRNAWLVDPAIRDYVDCALDYAYDWNIPGGVPGNGPLPGIQTAEALLKTLFSTAEAPQTEAPAVGGEAGSESQGDSVTPLNSGAIVGSAGLDAYLKSWSAANCFNARSRPR